MQNFELNTPPNKAAALMMLSELYKLLMSLPDSFWHETNEDSDFFEFVQNYCSDWVKFAERARRAEPDHE